MLNKSVNIIYQETSIRKFKTSKQSFCIRTIKYTYINKCRLVTVDYIFTIYTITAYTCSPFQSYLLLYLLRYDGFSPPLQCSIVVEPSSVIGCLAADCFILNVFTFHASLHALLHHISLLAAVV